MTETSGENPAWLYPTTGFPGSGAWSIALRIQQALTAGRESAWAYWQMTDGSAVGAETLTDSSNLQNSPKYVAAKHFFKYIRPNSICVNATVSGDSTLAAAAFLHVTNGTMTVVLINATNTPAQAVVNSPAQPVGITIMANLYFEQWQLLANVNHRYHQWPGHCECPRLRDRDPVWHGSAQTNRLPHTGPTIELVLAAQRKRLSASVRPQSRILHGPPWPPASSRSTVSPMGW